MASQFPPVQPGNPTDPAGSQDRRISRVAPDTLAGTDGRATREIEQVRARRVERADLVRSILQRKRAQDADGSEPHVADAREAAGAKVVTPQDLQWRVPEWDDSADAPGSAAGYGAGALGADTGAGAGGAGAGDANDAKFGSAAPGDQVHDIFGAAHAEFDARESVAIDRAAAPALEMLTMWWREDCEARYRVESAKQAEPNPRRRAKLDQDSELNLALRSEAGEDFMRSLVDDVLRPDDLLASGFGLSDLADRIPETLTPRARRGFQVGAFAGPGVPFIAVPAVRRAARRLFGAAIIAGGNDTLTGAIAEVTASGASARVMPLTDYVLGDFGATKLRERARALSAQAGVQEIELQWRCLVPNGSEWDFTGACDRTATQVADLVMHAMQARPHDPARIILRANNSRDAEATIETVIRTLRLDGMRMAKLGVALPANLPEASTLIRRLAGAVHLHREEGGLPVRVGLFRSADAGMERVDARLHEWLVASFIDEADIDANMLRCIDTVLASDNNGILELELEAAPLYDATIASALAAQRHALAPVTAIVPNGVGVGGASSADTSAEAASAGTASSGAAKLRQRLAQIRVATSVRIAQLPGDEFRPGTGYARALIDQARLAELERQAQLAEVTAIAQAHGTAIGEITSGAEAEDTMNSAAQQAAAPRDGFGPQQERLLSAISRMHQLPAGQLRTQTRVAPEDAPGVTAAIELELFPEGMFDDEAASPNAIQPPANDGPAGANSASGIEPAPAGSTTVLGQRDGDLDALLAGSGDAAAPEGDGTDAAARDGASQPPSATYDTSAQLANPDDTGAVPNLTEVVLGLRRGRTLRNTFRSTPDSDPTLPAIRDWARAIQRRSGRSQLGIDEAASHQINSTAAVSEVIERATSAGAAWSQTSGWERAAQLEQLAKAIEANRARLIEVAMSETCLTFDEVDQDVSRSVDLANYYAHLARQLDRMQGARFEPVQLTLVIPGWVPPVSSIANGVLTVLAAGSAALLVPPPRTERTAAILARVLWATDLPEDLVQLAANDHQRLSDEQISRTLIVDSRIERVLMQGQYETAAHFLDWRADLPLIGASGGKSSAIVTPAADYDLAARDLANSVIASGGQNPLRPSVVILVGAAARSERFTEQLADALASKRVGYPSDPVVDAGPLVTRADSKALEQLTSLAEGERWVLQPRSMDDTGRLWTAGIRVGVTRDSAAVTSDAKVPVVNLIAVRTLDEAIELQNSLDYGLGAGLYSLDRAEIAQWVQGVAAGNLYVNRDMLGVRVQQQPIGGWGRSMIGTKLKSGGPNALTHLGRWRADEHEQSNTLHLRGLEEHTSRLIEALQPSLKFEEFERVRRTALSCQIAWNETFGEVTDISNLRVERNLFRYRPAPCLIRFSADASAAELGQVLVAASAARAPIALSTAWELPPVLQRELAEREAVVIVESDEAFLQRMRTEGLRDYPRLRLLGGSRKAVLSALRNAVDIAVFSDDVTLAGRVEMLPFLREQAISITAHRFGRVDERVFALFPHETIVDPDASLLGK